MNRENIEKLLAKKLNYTSWEQKCKELEGEMEDRSLDVTVDYIKFKDDAIDKIYTQAYQIQYQIDQLDIANKKSNELINEVAQLAILHKRLADDYTKGIEESHEQFSIMSKQIRGFFQEMEDRTFPYIKTRAEEIKLNKRINVFTKRIVSMIMSLDEDCLAVKDNILKELSSDLLTLNKICNRKHQKESKMLIEESQAMIEEYQKIRKQHKKYKKIFDYKEMIREAESEGYERWRQGSTDHIIFRHTQSGKSVVIPTKELKYGLMLQIQKEIKTNKVA